MTAVTRFTRRVVGPIGVSVLTVLVAVPAVAYIPQRMLLDGTVYNMRWSPTTGFPIEWRVDSVQGPNVTGGNPQASVFTDSFQQWIDVATATIGFTRGADAPGSANVQFDGINEITTNVTPATFGSNAIGLAVTYAFTTPGVNDSEGRPIEFIGHILESDVMFNPGTQFSTNDTPPGDRIDLGAVATHEFGHLLGLDHSNMLSASMFPAVTAGDSGPRTVELDDAIGVSLLYPTTGFASTRGALGGSVRTTTNQAVFGAMVVAVDANGVAIASQVTDPDGGFTIQGLPPGNYTVYAEPMNGPFQPSDVFRLSSAFPGQTVNTNFTVRSR